jgi:hypothetical protein
MASDCHTDSETRTAGLWNDLCGLLEHGISLAKVGHWTRVEAVAMRMEIVAHDLAETVGFGGEIPEPQRARLKELYGQLKLAVQAQREETQGRLKKLRGVRRVVGVYGGNSSKR